MIFTRLFALWLVLAVSAAQARDEETNVFGVPQPISASLMGAFYDLKQTPTHRLTGMARGATRTSSTAT